MKRTNKTVHAKSKYYYKVSCVHLRDIRQNISITSEALDVRMTAKIYDLEANFHLTLTTAQVTLKSSVHFYYSWGWCLWQSHLNGTSSRTTHFHSSSSGNKSSDY